MSISTWKCKPPCQNTILWCRDRTYCAVWFVGNTLDYDAIVTPWCCLETDAAVDSGLGSGDQWWLAFHQGENEPKTRTNKTFISLEAVVWETSEESIRLAARISPRRDKWPAFVCGWMPCQNWLPIFCLCLTAVKDPPNKNGMIIWMLCQLYISFTVAPGSPGCAAMVITWTSFRTVLSGQRCLRVCQSPMSTADRSSWPDSDGSACVRASVW